MKLKAYSYIRMSTETQLQGDSLRRQTEASRRYAEAHELELVTDVDLHDIGVSAYSGDNVSHGKFGRFLEAVRAGQIEKGSYLLVESFDRISRQTPLTALESFKAIVEAGHNRGCQINGRWRYDHFEDAFLKFVERLDLASIVSSEEHQSKRADLVRQLDALEGRQKILENEIKTLLETSLKMSGGSDILARELTKREPALAEAKVNQAEVRQQIAQLDEAALAYYSNPDQMSDLIARVRATRGENVFKVRALIASRLQALISNVALDLEYNKSERAFEVDFRDGANLMAFVSQDDPTKITHVVRSYAGEFTVKDAEGNLIDADLMDDVG